MARFLEPIARELAELLRKTGDERNREGKRISSETYGVMDDLPLFVYHLDGFPSCSVRTEHSARRNSAGHDFELCARWLAVMSFADVVCPRGSSYAWCRKAAKPSLLRRPRRGCVPGIFDM